MNTYKAELPLNANDLETAIRAASSELISIPSIASMRILRSGLSFKIFLNFVEAAQVERTLVLTLAALENADKVITISDTSFMRSQEVPRGIGMGKEVFTFLSVFITESLEATNTSGEARISHSKNHYMDIVHKDPSVCRQIANNLALLKLLLENDCIKARPNNRG